MNKIFKDRIKKTREKVRTNLLHELGKMDKLFDPAQVHAEVTKALINERRTIVLQLLGIHWNEQENRAEVRPNQRNGVAAYMEKHCADAVAKWMADEILPLLEARGKDSLLQEKLKVSVLNCFEREFRHKLEWHATKIADRLAQEAAAAFAANVKELILHGEDDDIQPTDVQ